MQLVLAFFLPPLGVFVEKGKCDKGEILFRTAGIRVLVGFSLLAKLTSLRLCRRTHKYPAHDPWMDSGYHPRRVYNSQGEPATPGPERKLVPVVDGKRSFCVALRCR